MLQQILENLLASDADEVICVTDDVRAAREIKLSDSRLIWHFNSIAMHGQSTSVVAGLWASHPESEGVMIVAAEPPLVPKELINALIDRFVTSSASIIAPGIREQPPNPILFRRDLYSELLKLSGDDSGISLLERHSEKTALVEWPEEYLSNFAQRQTHASSKERA